MIDAIRYILINDAAVTALVAEASITALARVQGVSDLPCITIEKDGVTTSDQKNASSGMDRHRLFVHCHAENWDLANHIQRAARLALDQYTGVVSITSEYGTIDYGIELIRFVTDSDDYFDSDEALSTITLEFEVMEKRAGTPGSRAESSPYYPNVARTAEQWNAAADYVLRFGQIGLEFHGEGLPATWKVGDGVTPWDDLPYQSSGDGPGGGSVTWTMVTGKPDEFPAEPHTHPMNQVSGLETALASKANATHVHGIGDVTGLSAALGAKADLDGAGKIPTSQIPAIAISEFLDAVASEAAMLALVGQRGDWCVRTDDPNAGAYFLINESPTLIGSWQRLVTPGAQVQSVNGQTGVVVLGKADVGLSNVDNTPDAEKPVSTPQQNALFGKVDKVAGKQLSTEDYTSLEKTKLQAIQSNATANSSDAQLRDRSTHTGQQSIDTINDATDAGKNIVRLPNANVVRYLRVNGDNTVTPLTADEFRQAIGAPAKDTIAFSCKPVQTVAASTSTFNFIDGSWTFSTQAVRQEPIPYGGVFESLFVRLNANQTASGAVSVWLQINGQDTGLVVTVPAGTQTASIQNQNIAVEAGALVGYRIQNFATGASAIVGVINAGFRRTS